MKINIVKQFSAMVGAALLLGSGVASSRAALAFPPSPVFTNGVPAWDCIITGAKGERGIAFFTFSYAPDGFGNYQFDMRQIHTKVPVSIANVAVTTTNASNGRGNASGRGDTVVAGLTNVSQVAASTASTNIYGYLHTTGSWGYDYKGNILGFYIERVIDSITATNITYITNQVSFIGRATPNKRFTALYSSSIGGNGKYSGLPMKTVTNLVNGSDFSGPWTGNEIVGPLNTVELLTLTNTSGFPNHYDIFGDGPGYTLDFGGSSGKCLISCQKKFAIAINKYGLDGMPIRATLGDLKNTTKLLGGITKGLLQPGSNVVYNAYFVPFVPYP